ncbi:hypothetical protein Aph01nite_75130 [Acrocarpospora phusangensis]|uniref:Uncharacterized protein n=1 Tax=Acrocarpospora phusangensis TaxID=1070424 RepID=A0A919QK74_9ACTN|nr:hypothetical protein Aph01nite_75130 [Acrocarpospora phusangensis]
MPTEAAWDRRNAWKLRPIGVGAAVRRVAPVTTVAAGLGLVDDVSDVVHPYRMPKRIGLRVTGLWAKAATYQCAPAGNIDGLPWTYLERRR